MGLYLIDLANGLMDRPLLDNNLGENLITVMGGQHKYSTTTGPSYDDQVRNGAGKLLNTLGVAKLTKALDNFQYGLS